MKRGKVISLRITEDEYNYLANLSKNQGKNISEILRDMIKGSNSLDQYYKYVPTYCQPITTVNATQTYGQVFWNIVDGRDNHG